MHKIKQVSIMKKNKKSSFLFYSADFLVETAEMSDTEIGKYVKLIAYQHQKEGKLSEKLFKKIAGTNKNVLDKFVEQDGFYIKK